MTISCERLLAGLCGDLGTLGGVAELESGRGRRGSGRCAQLAVLQTIPVGGSGKWDYLYADSAARRLYVPRSTHTLILDLDKGTVLGDLADTRGVHGVAVAPAQIWASPPTAAPIRPPFSI